LIKKIWQWLTGNQSVNISITIKIEDLDKIIKFIPNYNNKPVIINHDINHGHSSSQNPNYEYKNNIQESNRIQKKKLADDPLDANEIASIMLADGIAKAKDFTGKDIVSESEGKSTDDTVSSLKRFRGGK
jgi:hypothetical protein